MKRLCIRFFLVWLIVGTVLAGTTAAGGAVSRSFFGVVQQGHLFTSDYATMGDGRVGTLRALVSWNDALQPSPDACCNWGVYDSLIGQAAANNVRVLPFVFGAPSWTVKNGVPSPPTNKRAVKAWQRFLKAFVDRYSRGGDFWTNSSSGEAKPIKTIQIWNEPGELGYWTNRKPDAREYARLVIRSHRAIKRADSKVKIMLAGLFTGKSRSRGRLPLGAFLRDFYRVRGIKRAFDVAAIHPYAVKTKTLKRRMRLMRRLMNRAGDKRTPIQVSELGWATAGPPGPFRTSLRGQAKRLRTSFALLRRNRSRWRVSGINWFSWRDIPSDAPGVCAFCPSTGLFAVNGSAKPAWKAFQKFTR